MRLGRFYKYFGHRRTSTGRMVARIEVEIEDYDMTASGTWAAQLKTKYDAAVAGDAPPPTPTLGQIILSSGKPAVFAMDADDVANFDALGTDAGIGTLTAAEGTSPN
jgi:hypothetical protein